MSLYEIGEQVIFSNKYLSLYPNFKVYYPLIIQMIENTPSISNNEIKMRKQYLAGNDGIYNWYWEEDLNKIEKDKINNLLKEISC